MRGGRAAQGSARAAGSGKWPPPAGRFLVRCAGFMGLRQLFFGLHTAPSPAATPLPGPATGDWLELEVSTLPPEAQPQPSDDKGSGGKRKGSKDAPGKAGGVAAKAGAEAAAAAQGAGSPPGDGEELEALVHLSYMRSWQVSWEGGMAVRRMVRLFGCRVAAPSDARMPCHPRPTIASSTCCPLQCPPRAGAFRQGADRLRVGLQLQRAHTGHAVPHTEIHTLCVPLLQGKFLLLASSAPSPSASAALLAFFPPTLVCGSCSHTVWELGPRAGGHPGQAAPAGFGGWLVAGGRQSHCLPRGLTSPSPGVLQATGHPKCRIRIAIIPVARQPPSELNLFVLNGVMVTQH